MLMEIKKKKHVLLEDEGLDWLQIWTTASSLDVIVKIAKPIGFPNGHIYEIVMIGNMNFYTHLKLSLKRVSLIIWMNISHKILRH